MTDISKPPTCKFFDPSQDTADQTGAVSSPDYPFNRHLLHNSCWSDLRALDETGQTAEYSWLPCMVGDYSAFGTCRFYEPETPERLRFVRIHIVNEDTFDEYVYLALDRIRLLYGVAEYRVFTWTSAADDTTLVPEDARIEAAINSDLNRSNFRTVATDIFDELLDGYISAGHEILEYTLGEIVDPASSYLTLITPGVSS